VLEKERSRENAEREKHALERQRLIALQAVNSAEANARAKRIEAEAEAFRVRGNAGPGLAIHRPRSSLSPLSRLGRIANPIQGRPSA